MIDYAKEKFKKVSTWKGAVALGAAIVMYFTPDEIDNIIIMALGVLGITDILSVEKQ